MASIMSFGLSAWEYNSLLSRNETCPVPEQDKVGNGTRELTRGKQRFLDVSPIPAMWNRRCLVNHMARFGVF